MAEVQRWEYCSIHLAGVGLLRDKGWQLWQINEQEQQNWKKSEIYASVNEFCNQMGQQGWELVCIAYPGELVTFAILHFKRSLQ